MDGLIQVGRVTQASFLKRLKWSFQKLGLDSQLRNIMSNEIKSVIASENAQADEQDEEVMETETKMSENDK